MFENFRRYRRYSTSAKAVIRGGAAELPEGLHTWVTTISQGGIGFYTTMPMKKATPVSVELLQLSQGVKKDVIEGRIASVTAQGSDYYIGIAFDREIAYDRFVELIG